MNEINHHWFNRLSLTIILIILFTGCIQTDDNQNEVIDDYYQNKIIYEDLMDNKIGNNNISNILEVTIEYWRSIGGTAEPFGGYANLTYNDIWEVGVFINANGEIIDYIWNFNSNSGVEIPISDAAKKLYI